LSNLNTKLSANLCMVHAAGRLSFRGYLNLFGLPSRIPLPFPASPTSSTPLPSHLHPHGGHQADGISSTSTRMFVLLTLTFLDLQDLQPFRDLRCHLRTPVAPVPAIMRGFRYEFLKACPSGMINDDTTKGGGPRTQFCNRDLRVQTTGQKCVCGRQPFS
jgi:hypothetical protein